VICGVVFLKATSLKFDLDAVLVVSHCSLYDRLVCLYLFRTNNDWNKQLKKTLYIKTIDVPELNGFLT